MIKTIHQFLSFSQAYKFATHLIGGEDVLERYAQNYIRYKPGYRILDLGCGPACILQHLHDVEYVGLDFEEKYIAAAKAKYGNRGSFFQRDVMTIQEGEFTNFDVVLATGLLHHLDDEVALGVLRAARMALRPGGRLLTYDGCFLPTKQHPIDKWVLSNDRGKYVRKLDQYLNLANQHFDDVTPHIRQDLLKIPYTLLIMECTAPIAVPEQRQLVSVASGER